MIGTTRTTSFDRKTEPQRVGPAADPLQHAEVFTTQLGILRMQRAVGNRAVNDVIQTKLTISVPGDRHEVEADRVADRVMRMPGHELTNRSQTETTATADKEHDGDGQILRACECPETVQRTSPQTSVGKPGSQFVPEGLGRAIDSSRGGGQPLPTTARGFFEPRLGRDFNQVRVHTGDQAASLARAVNARAFTVGRDIFFGANQYSPETRTGQRLVAHELTHVIQQDRSATAAAGAMHLQRAPAPKTDAPAPAGSSEAVLIATIVAAAGDTPQSIMIRALKQIGVAEDVAKVFTAKMTLNVFTQPKPGDPYPVFLTKELLDQLGVAIQEYEEGESSEVKVEAPKKPGGDDDGGLGLIEVPSWVVSILKVADFVLTIVGFFTGAAAIASLFKVLAKQLMKRAIKKAITEAAEKAAERIAQEAIKKITKKAAREGLDEALTEATKQAVKKEIKKSAEAAAKTALKKSMKNATDKEIDAAARELAEEISEKVAEKAAKQAAGKIIKEATKDFLTSSGVLKNAARAKIPLEKITEYSLNAAHPVGGNKARVIEAALGYTKKNYQGFVRQLQEGVAKNKAILGQADRHGQRFTVYIEMTGPRGKAIVESGWMFDPGSNVPRLLTAFIP